MDLKEFLKDNPVINKAEFSRLMWGDNAPATKLANKLAGHGKQRVTEKDEETAKKVLISLARKILDYSEK